MHLDERDLVVLCHIDDSFWGGHYTIHVTSLLECALRLSKYGLVVCHDDRSPAYLTTTEKGKRFVRFLSELGVILYDAQEE